MSVITPRQKVTHASTVTYCRTVQSFATQMMPKPLKQLLCEPCITLSSWRCAFVCVFGGGVYELFCNCSEMVLKCFKSDWIELLLLLSLLSPQSDKRNKLSAQGVLWYAPLNICHNKTCISSSNPTKRKQVSESNDREEPERERGVRFW